MKSSITNLAIALIASVPISGCGEVSPPRVEFETVTSPLRDERGKFTLVITNQCPSMKWIDCKVEVDDEMVVHDLFHIGQGDRYQHTDKRFKLALAPGEHRLRVTSVLGKTEQRQSFRVEAESWGAYLNIYCPPKDPASDSVGFQVLSKEFLWK